MEQAGGAVVAPGETRAIFDPALGQTAEAAILARDAIATGDVVDGPAAIVEDETTIIVPSSRRAVRQADGCIDVGVKG